jgi:two-component system, NtrC family, response regulator AtoC
MVAPSTGIGGCGEIAMQIRKSILLAAAADGSRKAMEEALRGAGHDVVIAEVGSEAVKVALDRNPAVAIIDLDLAELPGLSVIEILKRARPHLPVVVLAGDASIELGRRVLQLGVFYLLVKPVDPDEAQSAVESALASRRQGAAA